MAKKNIKVKDLKPRKDAKGGGSSLATQNLSGQNLSGQSISGQNMSSAVVKTNNKAND